MLTLFLILGLVLLLAYLFDSLFTTIGTQEHAVMSLRLARLLFRAIRRLPFVRRRTWVHRLTGPFLMTLVAANWVVGMSVGWTLIFAAFPGSVAPAPGQPLPGWWDVYGHVGHLLSTLGLETTSPGSTVWYVLGSFVAVNGFAIVTLAVSFTLSTTQTVAQGRAFAVLWKVLDPARPESFSTLAPLLAQLASSLKTSPFAMFYSSGSEDLRVPETLVPFARRAADGPDFARYAELLSLLPLYSPPDTDDPRQQLAALAEWCADYSLGAAPRSPSGSET